MFENKQKTNVKALGEFGLIEHLTSTIKLKHKESALGIGDDAAVLDNEMSQVVSTDLLVEGVHFDLTYTPLMHLGYKAVVVSVSDICAMNAIPKQLFISIAVSSKYTLEALEELYKGINAACEKYNLDFVGGDTSSAVSGLTISSTVIGTTQQDNVVKRSGAKEGNLLCVSGDLGGAYVGLQILEREKSVFKDQPNMQPDLAAYDYIIGRQLRPEARIDVIELLEELKLKPTSMIDISDGLSSEIFHLCKASNVGMKLFEDKLPIDQQTYDTALSLNLAPTTCALNGGEDYELAFTLDQSSFEKVKNSPDISIVGYCTAAHEGKTIVTKSENVLELEAQGWQSFS